jgi:hypothetical protein
VVFALDPATGAPIGVDRVSEIEADPTDTDAPNAIIVEAEPFEIADEAQDERDDERATDEATPAPEAPPEPLGGDPAPPEGEPQEDEPRMFVPVAGVYVGQGLILAISDADLLWNGALVLRRNGAFLRSLVNARGPCDGPCVVSLATLSGGGADTPLDTMLNARMMPFVLHLLAWWALLGVARGVRFRHAPEPAVDDRADFREHARALGRHYERLDATAHAAARLAAFHLGQHGGGRQGLELALGRAGWSTTDAAALAREADERARGERHDHHRPDPWFLEEMCRIR